MSFSSKVRLKVRKTLFFLLITGTNVFSPNVIESGTFLLVNSGILHLFLWNSESWASESRTQLKESGADSFNYWNPESMLHWQRIPDAGIHVVKSRVQVRMSWNPLHGVIFFQNQFIQQLKTLTSRELLPFKTKIIICYLPAGHNFAG